MGSEFEMVAWFRSTDDCDIGPSPLERGSQLSGECLPPPSMEAAVRYGITSRRPSIVIWYHPLCSACRNSKPVFTALEQNTDGFVVYTMVATPEIVREMVDTGGNLHLTMLPTYDIMWPHTGSDSVYGMDWKVVSILPNDLSLLQHYVPSLKGIMQSSQ